MTTIAVGEGSGGLDLEAYDFSIIASPDFISLERGSTTISGQLGTAIYTLHGRFLHDGAGDLVGGAVTDYSVVDVNGLVFRFDLSVSIDTLRYWSSRPGLEGTQSMLVGADVITGSSFADRLFGYNGNDSINGAGGADEVYGGLGNDTIDGGPGLNYLRGDEGNDSINGGAAFDDINGNMGADTAHGGDGGDWVVGGKDNDVLFGDAGDDIVYGNIGADTCDGGDGNDIVRGGQDNDVLTGGAGNDWLSGDKGSDTITGGAGADIFHAFQDSGIDRVMDFSLAQGDRVQLDPGTTYTVSQIGADTVVDMGGGNQLILVGVSLSSLSGAWIFGA